MKKILILTSALCLLGSYAANAQISVGIGIGEPAYAPGYVMAPDYPSYHYDRHRHNHNDYWANKMPRGRDDHDRR